MKRVVIPMSISALVLTAFLLFRPDREGGPLVLSGVLEAREVDVASRVGGRVSSLSADEGESVDSGQVLAKLSVSDLPAQRRASASEVEATRAALSQTEATLKLAQSDLARYEQLYSEGVITVAQVEAYRTAAESAAEARRNAEGRLAAARARYDVTRATEGETEVCSPIAGTVLLRLREQGEVVAVGAPIYVLADLSELELVVYIPEPRLAEVSPGDSALVRVDAFPDSTFPAVVARVSDEAEFTPRFVQTTETRVDLVFAATLRLRNDNRRLRPGMPADAEFTP